MKIKLLKAKDNMHRCNYDGCEKNPEYTTKAGSIRKGTICASIRVYSANRSKSHILNYYCRSCIDKVYNDVRASLNSNLWVFK